MTVSIAKPLSVKLDAQTRARIENLAASRRRTTHWMMREAIAQYIEREEQRNSLQQDAVAAWEAYQAKGLHLTLEEADAWMAKLEAGQDVEPPPCHV
ncbi:MAG: CopG family transcriptional regulator [Comamonadaceae bacterium CG1_02_60_18]|nr:MAG: CopG family transcriptional regulator [Comamonadaceae bacterium CG1_02_60_18]PIQ51361.1 MAG: CopG family transcriptional regulator [Comamonadaceae bacterium CG12_big_fil_rev_8_21_14_0_65_59_15]